MKKCFYILILFLVACGCDKSEVLLNSETSNKKQEHIIMTKQVYTGSLLLMDHSDRYTAYCDVVTMCLKKLELLEAANEY